MVNETKLEDINPLVDIKNKVWQILDIFKHEPIDAVNYPFILFLLSLQKDGILNGLIYTNAEDLKDEFRNAIEKLGDDSSEAYKTLLHFYLPLISPISERGFQHIIQSLHSLNQPVLIEHFAEIFDDLLYKISKSQGRYGGEFIQPVELSRFVCRLAELPKSAKVYNPFAGLASFGVFLNQGQYYFGQEINKVTWATGALRIMAYERESVSQFHSDDTINHWNPRAEKYDLVVSNPPFGLRLQQDISGQFGSIRTFEHFLIEKGVEDLKAKGKLIAVIPNGFLYRSGAEQNLRQFLVESDQLEMVISFPGGMLMNTGIPINILVINKDKKEKGVVRFIDAKSCVVSLKHGDKKLNENALDSVVRNTKEADGIRIVSNDEIRNFNFNLSVPRYFQKQIDGVLLGELVAIIPGQRNMEGRQGKFIRIRDLKDDKLEYHLNLNGIERTEIPRPAQQISESCLLLATRWKTLKPTYFKFDGEPIFIIPDTIALKVDETKVEINYLINELHSKYVTDQLESYRIGEIIPSIRRDDLLKIRIQIPSLLEQRAKVKGSLETLADEKFKELNLFKKIHGLESEIAEQNIYLRHTLAGPISNLKGSINKLKKIISDKVLLKVPEIMTLKVSEQHDLTFGEYISIIERDIIKITDAVSRQLSIETDISSKELTPIEIIDFLKGFKSEYSDGNKINFKIDLDFDKEMFANEQGDLRKTYILGNAELLTDLFNNLIDNAIKHAFQKGNNNRIEIYLMSSSQVEINNEITIIFSNTGKPFPENFSENDFIRKGSKAGLNSGNGFGGWYIYEIIKRLNGDLYMIDETGPEGLGNTDLATSFEIDFPIIEMDEHEEI